jgi:hypothetical protein
MPARETLRNRKRPLTALSAVGIINQSFSFFPSSSHRSFFIQWSPFTATPSATITYPSQYILEKVETKS